MLFDRSGPGHDYERVIAVARPEVGLRALIAMHSTAAGPAFGGIRRRRYPDERAALADALALAEAMSHKCALARLPAGGAKTVILDTPARTPNSWAAAYRALGEEIARLDGQYVCGPDLGTGEPELSAVRSVCTHVNPLGNDAGVSTAAGVHAGLRALWRVLDVPQGQRSVAVSGLGSVGLALARALLREGIAVVGADIDPAACRAAAQAGVTVVEPEALWSQPCTVVSPCATGHVLDEPTIERLRCRAVCGSANNQLAGPRAAGQLAARSIVHAPDVVVSAGAVIEGVLTDAATRGRVVERIAAIEGTLGRVLDEAAARGCPPTDAAQAIARARLTGAA